MPIFLGNQEIGLASLGNLPVANMQQYNLQIGDFFQGGYIFYFNDVSKKSGLIMTQAAPTQPLWGCGGTSISTSAALGTGQSNTNNILAACATRPICASVADSYSINGYTDWYLGSEDEMEQLMLASINYGSSPFDIQRSQVIATSTESTATLSVYILLNFNNTSYSLGQANKGGDSFQYVIPIRSFSL